MFPKAALIPPWAATVCDLVGKSLEMHAVLRPASTNPKAAYGLFLDFKKFKIFFIFIFLKLINFFIYFLLNFRV